LLGGEGGEAFGLHILDGLIPARGAKGLICIPAGGLDAVEVNLTILVAIQPAHAVDLHHPLHRSRSVKSASETVNGEIRFS
jgi:hypothetical protein